MIGRGARTKKLKSTKSCLFRKTFTGKTYWKSNYCSRFRHKLQAEPYTPATERVSFGREGVDAPGHYGTPPRETKHDRTPSPKGRYPPRDDFEQSTKPSFRREMSPPR